MNFGGSDMNLNAGFKDLFDELGLASDLDNRDTYLEALKDLTET